MARLSCCQFFEPLPTKLVQFDCRPPPGAFKATRGPGGVVVSFPASKPAPARYELVAVPLDGGRPIRLTLKPGGMLTGLTLGVDYYVTTIAHSANGTVLSESKAERFTMPGYGRQRAACTHVVICWHA